MYEVEKKSQKEDGDDEAKKNRRYGFRKGFCLEKEYCLRLRSKFPIPILGGANPPKLPTTTGGGRQASIARNTWAGYWATCLFPWRTVGEHWNVGYHAVSRWMLAALRCELGEENRLKALFMSNVSFSTERPTSELALLDRLAMECPC